MTRLKAKGVVDRASDVARDSSTSKLDGDDDDVKCESRLHAELEAIKVRGRIVSGRLGVSFSRDHPISSFSAVSHLSRVTCVKVKP